METPRSPYWTRRSRRPMCRRGRKALQERRRKRGPCLSPHCSGRRPYPTAMDRHGWMGCKRMVFPVRWTTPSHRWAVGRGRTARRSSPPPLLPPILPCPPARGRAHPPPTPLLSTIHPCEGLIPTAMTEGRESTPRRRKKEEYPSTRGPFFRRFRVPQRRRSRNGGRHMGRKARTRRHPLAPFFRANPPPLSRWISTTPQCVRQIRERKSSPPLMASVRRR